MASLSTIEGLRIELQPAILSPWIVKLYRHGRKLREERCWSETEEDARRMGETMMELERLDQCNKRQAGRGGRDD